MAPSCSSPLVGQELRKKLHISTRASMSETGLAALCKRAERVLGGASSRQASWGMARSRPGQAQATTPEGVSQAALCCLVSTAQRTLREGLRSHYCGSRRVTRSSCNGNGQRGVDDGQLQWLAVSATRPLNSARPCKRASEPFSRRESRISFRQHSTTRAHLLLS